MNDPDYIERQAKEENDTYCVGERKKPSESVSFCWRTVSVCWKIGVSISYSLNFFHFSVVCGEGGGRSLGDSREKVPLPDCRN